MALSPWFDANVYMTNKLAQLKNDFPDTKWTMDDVVKAFEANGFVGPEGAEAHFMQFGQFEDVAPNTFFNPMEYYRAKAALVYDKLDNPKSVTDPEVAFVKAAIKGLGMGAWGHYDAFGSEEKVNPSNGFDTEKYMIAKKDALNANLADGQTAYTLENVYAAFKAAGISALEHFMTFGGNGNKGEVAQKYDPKNPAIPTEFAVDDNKKVNSGGSNVGDTFALKAGADSLTGTPGDDTFEGVAQGATATDTGTLNSVDNLKGGEGNDTLNVRVTALTGAHTVAPSLSSIENVLISSVDAGTNVFTLNLASATGTTHVGFKDTVESSQTTIINAAANATVVLDNADATTSTVNAVAITGTHSVNLQGSASRGGTADAIALQFKNGAGSAARSADLQFVAADGTTADATFEVANITVEGAASYVNIADGGANFRTFNVSGNATADGNGYGLTLTGTANFAEARVINASVMTGGGLNIATTLEQDVTFTGSAGNDRLHVTAGIANLNAADKLTFGAGTDTLALGGDITAANYTSAQIALINGITDVERLEFTKAVADAGSVVKANDFTVVNTFVLSGGQANAGNASADTWALTGVESADTIIVSGTYNPGKQAQSASSGVAGFDVLDITGATTNQTANIRLENASLTGQEGQAGAASGNTGGAGGHAINFSSNITKLVIESEGASANTLTGGKGGAGTATVGESNGGSAIANGTQVQVIEIKGHQDLTIQGGSAGTGGGGAAGSAGVGFTGAVNVDASKLEAKLTITGSNAASGDTIKVGTKGSEVHATEGADSITFGAGNDVMIYTNVNQSLTSVTDDNKILDSIDKLSSWGTGKDKIDVGAVTGITGSGFASSEFVAQNVVQAAVNAVTPTSLKEAADAAAAKIGVDKIGVFQYSGNTYVLGQDGGAAFATTDLLIQIIGEHSLTADSFVFA